MLKYIYFNAKKNKNHKCFQNHGTVSTFMCDVMCPHLLSSQYVMYQNVLHTYVCMDFTMSCSPQLLYTEYVMYQNVLLHTYSFILNVPNVCFMQMLNHKCSGLVVLANTTHPAAYSTSTLKISL